jgi:hypothetical protein
VQLNRKTAFLAALLFGAVMLGTGCSGINASHSVSPATFLIPGFFGQTPAAPAPAPDPAVPVSIVQPAPVQTFAPAD